MSKKDSYRFIAQTVSAAWVLTGSTASTAFGPFLAPVAGLVGLRRDKTGETFAAALDDAEDAAFAALEHHPEFTETDLSRARDLLEKAGPIRLNPTTYAETAKNGGDPDAVLTGAVLVAIPFAADDHGPRAVAELVLTYVVAKCRTHPAIDTAIMRELLLQGARDNGIQITLLTRIDETTRRTEIKVDRLTEQFRSQSTNQYDLGHQAGRRSGLSEAARVILYLENTGHTIDELWMLYFALKQRELTLREGIEIIATSEVPRDVR